MALKRAEGLGLPYLDLRKAAVSMEAIKSISKEEAEGGILLPVQRKDKEVALACFDPRLPEAKKVLERLSANKLAVQIFISSESGIRENFRFYEFIPGPTEEITGSIEVSLERMNKYQEDFPTFEKIHQSFSSLDYAHTPTTDLFQMIIGASVVARASDIHLESIEGGMRLRYRVDGILHDVAEKMPPGPCGHLMTRLKLLSELKLNVRDEAQDGRFTIRMAEKDVEVRVSIIPSEYGETAVLRILDPSAIMVTMPQLGLREDDLKLVESELAKPNGLILNTGPTGSGKTTTLYAFLRHTHSPEVKIITVEDPIEYHLEGIQQTQVEPDSGYTFASGLRSILRQDPDVILVGEIRDAETADIALQAALTGHIVFSTLHTNDAVGAVPRLVDLGVKNSTIAPALSLVIAQRLVRKLCKDCRVQSAMPEDIKLKFQSFLETLPARVDRKPYEEVLQKGLWWEKKGCSVCNGFGYKGRVGVFEFFKKDDNLEESIMKDPSPLSLRKIAASQGMVSMQQDGLLKVILGETTLEEVEGATGPAFPK